jgi:S-(hydroxymethyl)glutathione dehydrogenase/alcohol dehydrogenase
LINISTMKAAVVHQPGTKLVIEEVQLEKPRNDEVLVKIAASGVCFSDWHLITGATPHPLPAIPGHEGAGIVHEVGKGVKRVKPGDHIVLTWAPGCGECFYCLRRLPAHCERAYEWLWQGTLQDGTSRFRLGDKPVYHFSASSTFAEQTVVPEISCIPIRKDIPLAQAALVGCSVTTGIGAVVNTAQVRAGESIAVFGCGGVGINIIQAAALSGAEKIIAVDTVPFKLSLARTFGATHFVNVQEQPVFDMIYGWTDNRGVDKAFEATGRPEVMQQAISATRKGGTTVLAGIGPHGSSIQISASEFPRQSKHIVSSYYGDSYPRYDIPRILDLYAAGKIKLDELITRRYHLGEINAAFQDMLAGEVARGVIEFE